MRVTTNPTKTWRLLAVLLLILPLSQCGGSEDTPEATGLSADEAYLVEAYSSIAKAWEHAGVSPLLAESLFTALDSTIDTLRIANTIDALNEDPERWILIFREIDKSLQMSSQGRQLEETR